MEKRTVENFLSLQFGFLMSNFVRELEVYTHKTQGKMRGDEKPQSNIKQR